MGERTDRIMALACAVGSHDWFEALSEAVQELEDECERNMKDAERYRWLRDCRPESLKRISDGYPFIPAGDALDDAIDAAIAQEKK